MENTRKSWLPAAQSADWFSLSRHDDPDPADPEPALEPEGDPADPEPDPDPEGADKLGDAGKKALEAMKAQRAEAKRLAAAEKKRADDLARKVQEFEDRDKSDLDKATAKAERLEAAAKAATARAAKAEVRAAAGEFADPEDAVAFLDLAKYTSDDGEIDTEAISADLADLLERKPHLRRQAAEPQKKPAPKPDPSQGARPAEPPTDFRTVDRETLEVELAKVAPGFRLRS
jgi:ATPase subunit of ABC transporter with duplicated ATPase domains